MHAQQLGPAAAAAAAAAHPPLPMLPHPGLPGAPLPPSSAASLLGLSALGAPHPLAMLNAKHDLHREDKLPGMWLNCTAYEQIHWPIMYQEDMEKKAGQI